jgi:hypothetical protein
LATPRTLRAILSALLVGIGVIVTISANGQPSPEEARLQKELSERITRVFELAFRSESSSDVSDREFLDFRPKSAVLEEVKQLKAFVERYCFSNLNCYHRGPGPPPDDVRHYLTILELQAAHGDSPSELVETIRALGRLTAHDVPDVPSPVQMHRRSPTLILSNPSLTEAGLAAQFALYRRRINAATLDVGESQDWEMDLIRLDDPNAEGVRFRVRSGPPMFNYPSLFTFEATDSKQAASDTLPLRDTEDKRGTYRLTPADQVPQSSLIVEYAWSIAESRLLFACDPDDDEGRCYFLAASGARDDATYQVSLCEVQGNVEDDPPTWCKPFIVKNGNHIWIAVVDTFERAGYGSGELSPAAAEIRLRLYLDRSPFDLFPVFAEALGAAPLLLDVQVSAASVRGTSAQRASQILSTKLDRWNEWMMIIVEQEDCSDEGTPQRWQRLHQICASFTLNLLVNKQRDSNRTSWHPASETLAARMVNQVKDSFRKILSRSCKREEVLGDRMACFVEG